MHVDVGNRETVRAVSLRDDLSLGRNDHRAATALRDDQPDEIFRGAHPQRLNSDVVVTDRGTAHRREEDDVRARQREAACRLRHHEVVTDQHPGRAQVRSVVGCLKSVRSRITTAGVAGGIERGVKL